VGVGRGAERAWCEGEEGVLCKWSVHGASEWGWSEDVVFGHTIYTSSPDCKK